MPYEEIEATVSVYWTQHMAAFNDIYNKTWNAMAYIKDEIARARAVNGYMVVITKALGMETLGCATLDDTNAEAEVALSVFGKKKAGGQSYSGGGFQKKPYSGGQQSQQTQPAQQTQSGGNYQKKQPYQPSGKPLQGAITEPQRNLIENSLNKAKDDVKEGIWKMLDSFGKGGVEELTKEEASQVISAIKSGNFPQ